MEQVNASLKTLTLIFAGLYLLMTALFAFVVFLLLAMFQFNAGGSYMSIVIPMISAVQVGTIYFNRTGLRPASPFAWKAGASFALTSVLLSFVMVSMLYLIGLVPDLKVMLSDAKFLPFLLVMIVVLSALLVVVCRFGFSFGARQAEKMKEKAQTRG